MKNERRDESASLQKKLDCKIMKNKILVFDEWNDLKKEVDFKNKKTFFKEGEIRWVIFGKNIGSEAFGKDKLFSRPVLILRKVYGHSCLGILLTTKKKEGNYYFEFSFTNSKRAKILFYALLTQIRYIDGRRIMDKEGWISFELLSEIRNSVSGLIKNTPSIT